MKIPSASEIHAARKRCAEDKIKEEEVRVGKILAEGLNHVLFRALHQEFLCVSFQSPKNQLLTFEVVSRLLDGKGYTVVIKEEHVLVTWPLATL